MDDETTAETAAAGNLGLASPEREALLSTFREITASSSSEALFFLESHNFDLDAAVSTFLETNHNADDADSRGNAIAAPVPAGRTIVPQQLPQSPTDSRSYSPSDSSSPSRSRSPSPPRNRHSRPTTTYNLRSSKKRKSTGAGAGSSTGGRSTGGIHTVADLNRRPANSSDSDSDDPQEYYTGGEKSGMLVKDPSNIDDPEAIFNQARQLAGAVEGPAENLLPSSSSRNFTGTARLLSGDTLSHTPQEPEVITYVSNGYTGDNGPLRNFNDPENASFLESVRKSECPKELEPSNGRSTAHVKLVRREENFVVSKKGKSSFQGIGRTLGSSDNTFEPSNISSPLPTTPAPSSELVVDPNLPSTSIQLRLVDGTRLVTQFNCHHTIRDIRNMVDASRPGGSRTYQLQTVGFPPKLLTDLDQTIDQAGLANSVVIQKL